MFKQFIRQSGVCLLLLLLGASAPAVAQNQPSGAGQPDQTFWETIKDTDLPDLFEMFVQRYPHSAHRSEAEQKLRLLQQRQQPSALEQAKRLTGKSQQNAPLMRSVTPMPAPAIRAPALGAPMQAPKTAEPAPAAPAHIETATQQESGQESGQALPDARSQSTQGEDELSGTTRIETIILLQHNLNRLGCGSGMLDGKWGAKSQKAAERFARTIDQPLVTDTPNRDLLHVLKAYEPGTCTSTARPAPLFKRPAHRSHFQRVRSRPAVRKAHRPQKVKKYFLRKKVYKKARKKNRVIRKHSRSKKRTKRVVRKIRKHKKVKTAKKIVKRKKARKIRKVKKARVVKRVRNTRSRRSSSSAAASVVQILAKSHRRHHGGSHPNKAGNGGSGNGGGQSFSYKGPLLKPRRPSGGSFHRPTFKRPSIRGVLRSNHGSFHKGGFGRRRH